MNFAFLTLTGIMNFAPKNFNEIKEKPSFLFCEIDKTFLMVNECGFLKLFAVFNHNRKPSQTKSMTHTLLLF